MKKTLLSILGACFLACNVSAQCTPDMSFTQVGVYPIPFVPATEGIPYSEVINFKFPADTMFLQTTIPFDSIRIASVQDVPTGFSYQCSESTCTYPGGANGCLLLTGTAEPGSAGTYDVVVRLTAYFRDPILNNPISQSTNQTIPFVVEQNTTSTGKELSRPEFTVMQNQPNPFSGKTKVNFVSINGGEMHFRVHDILGNEVYANTIQALPGANQINFDGVDLKSGIYVYSLCSKGYCSTKRMLKR